MKPSGRFAVWFSLILAGLSLGFVFPFAPTPLSHGSADATPVLTWGSNVRINAEPAGPDQCIPALASNSDGMLYVAWHSHISGKHAIWFSRSTDGGASWSPAVRVSDTDGTTDQTKPSIAASGPNRVYVAWSDQRTSTRGDIYSAQSSDGGSTWSKNVRVNDDHVSADHHNPALSAVPENKVYVVWQDNRITRDGAFNEDFSRSADGGATWYPNIKLDSHGPEASSCWPDLAVGYNKQVYAAWHDSRSGIWDIFVVRSLNEGGTWGPNIRVNDDSGTTRGHYHPSLAVGPADEVYVTWEDYRRNNSTADVYFSRSFDEGVTWQANVRVNDDAVGSDHTRSAVVALADGSLVALWRDHRNGDDDMYASASVERGAKWLTNVRVNDDSTWAVQENPRLAPLPDGAYAVWADYRSGQCNVYGAAGRLSGYVTNTPTPSATPTSTATATLTNTPTATPSPTATSTQTPTPSPTYTPTVTFTPSATPTPTVTGTPTSTRAVQRLYAPLIVKLPTPAADPYEPNDTRSQAWGPLGSGIDYQAYIYSPTDTEDFYYFVMNSTHSVEIWLRAIPEENDYDLYLYDSSATPRLLGYSGNYGDLDEHILTTTLPPGRYYIRVRRVEGFSTRQMYRLRAIY